jgi:SAM-dependent methyltransferase
MNLSESDLVQIRDVTQAPQVMLSEVQNATFDTEFHSPKELAAKLKVLRAHFGDRPVRLLDIGGGNGVFTDSLFAEFPGWTSTIIDVSELLLHANKPHPSKRVIHGSLFDIDTLLPYAQFDCICINWVFHHLVGSDYASSIRNITHAIDLLSRRLAPGGLMCIGENRYDPVIGHNISARLIFEITAVRTPWIARLVGKHANTAGVGVCFQSEAAWRHLFAKAGLREAYPVFHYKPFNIKGIKKVALLLKEASQVHFHMVPVTD